MDAPPRVLLLEPEDSLRSILTELLESDGFAVTPVACAEGGHVEAFEAINRKTPFAAFVLSLDCDRGPRDYLPENIITNVRLWQLDVPAICHTRSLELLRDLEGCISHPCHLLLRTAVPRFVIELREVLLTALERPAHPS